jgi:hypothetical protein
MKPSGRIFDMNLIVDPRPVLKDPKSNEDMQNAIGILKIIFPREKEIQDGKSKSQQEVFKNVDNLLKDKLR